MLNSQVFNSDTMRLQTLNMPHGESCLLECTGLGSVISLAPILRTNKPAKNIVQRNCHSLTLEMEY